MSRITYCQPDFGQPGYRCFVAHRQVAAALRGPYDAGPRPASASGLPRVSPPATQMM